MAELVFSLIGVAVGAVLNPVADKITALCFKILAEHKSEGCKSFYDEILLIKQECRMLAASTVEKIRVEPLWGDQGGPTNEKINKVRELLYDTEDFLDRIVCCCECGGSCNTTMEGFAPRRRKTVEELKNEAKMLGVRLKEAAEDLLKDSGNQDNGPSSTWEDMDVPDAVGLDEPVQELRELLEEGQPGKLRVISIVGFARSGKTTLAKKLYNSVASGEFDCKALVDASKHKDTRGLLTALLKELRREGDPPGDVQVEKLLKSDIREILNTKRYLIVLDDINEDQWNHIGSAFPGSRGRIIVTTSTQTAARVCSMNGYVYNMRDLNPRHSEELVEAVLGKSCPALQPPNSTSILDKCHGHPLCLLSVAKYLQRHGVLRQQDCQKFLTNLGDHMNDPAFTELRQVLINNYRSLPSSNLKICLQYMCVFPNGHPIKRNRLIRRWLAEGYVQNGDASLDKLAEGYVQNGDASLDKLIEQNIIRPIIKKNAKVKSCTAHGIMHEFMLHMAKSLEFIISFRHSDRSKYRHLFLDQRPSADAGTSGDGNKTFRAHSLTICGSAADAVADLAQCELLRVLDLEECSDLENKVINKIHELGHLRYLSLGENISELPRNIEKLHCLETLDMRKTKIITLPDEKLAEVPVEVIMLPHLARLLGKFKLKETNLETHKVQAVLDKKSQLQTLAGFVIDRDHKFLELMKFMNKLNKVKIWCNAVDKDSLVFELAVAAIVLFVKKHLVTPGDDYSLSLHLGSSSKDILTCLVDELTIASQRWTKAGEQGDQGPHKAIFYLGSLKLHGELHGLTQFATLMDGLTELCLSTINNLKVEELRNLCKLKRLEYLKLVGVTLEGFVIGEQDFKALLHLSLVQCPSLPRIKKGAMPNLVSLWLLHHDLDGLSGIDIEQHERLQELALDSKVKPDTQTKWETAAKKHPNRPRVWYLKEDKSAGSVVKYVAAEDGPEPGTRSSSELQDERQVAQVQLISANGGGSARTHANKAGPSVASKPMTWLKRAFRIR